MSGAKRIRAFVVNPAAVDRVETIAVAGAGAARCCDGTAATAWTDARRTTLAVVFVDTADGTAASVVHLNPLGPGVEPQTSADACGWLGAAA